MEPILIGTNLQDINDNDTLEQILRKIASNQKSLFEQIIEIVKFYNAAYTTDDNSADINTTVNVGSIKSVSLKYGVLYVNYVGVDGTNEVIKFRLNNATSDTTTNGSSIYTLVYFSENGSANQLPNAPVGSYAYNNGHFYLKDNTGWTLVDDAYNGVYMIYDNTMYKYDSTNGAIVVLRSVTPTQLEDYATIEGVTEALSEIEDTISRIYNRIVVIKAYGDEDNAVNLSTLNPGDFYIENGKLIEYTGLGPGKEVDINFDKAFFLYNGELISIRNGEKVVNIKKIDDNVITSLNNRITSANNNITNLLKKRVNFIEIAAFWYYGNGFDGTVTEETKATAESGDLLLIYDVPNIEYHLISVTGPQKETTEIYLDLNDLDSKGVYYLYNGGVYKIKNNTFKQITVNNEDIYDNGLKIVYGLVVEDTNDIRHADEPYDYGDGTIADVTLGLSENDTEIFRWVNNNYELYSYYNNYKGSIIFVDRDAKKIYVKRRGESFICLFDCGWTNNIPATGYVGDTRFTTVYGVALKLKDKLPRTNAALEGTPTAPTAPAGTNTNQIATTKFVAEAIAAAMLEDADVDLSGVLEDIDTLFDTKLELIKVKYLVEDLANATNPVTNDKAILFSEGSTPVLYSYNSGSWSEQVAEANAHLMDRNVGIVYNNKLIQWDSSANTFKTIVGVDVDNALSSNSNNPVSNKIVKQALDGKASTSALNAKAPLESPTFTGTPKSTTPATTDNSTKIATTAFVKAVLASAGLDPTALNKKTRVIVTEAIEYGTETATTNGYKSVVCVESSDVILFTVLDADSEPVDVNDYNQEFIDVSNNVLVIATSSNSIYAWDNDEEDFVIVVNGEPATSLNVSEKRAVASYVVYNALNKKAPIKDAQFTGEPTAPTANTDDNSDRIATTAFVKSAINSILDSVPIPEDNIPGPGDVEGSDSADNTTYVKTAVLNPELGNLGYVRVNKDPEDIEVTDIDDTAYPLPELYDDVSVGKVEGTPSIWTAEDIGLTYVEIPSSYLVTNDFPASVINIGKQNTHALKVALEDENCVGVKLDRVYYLYVNNGGNVKGTVSDYNRVVIPRDFIIDGEVNGEAVGGFCVYRTFSYVKASLRMNKCVIRKIRSDEYPVFWIDCSAGIDQIVLKDCVYTTGNSNPFYNGYYLNFANKAFYDSNYVLSEDNYINHLYIDGCVCENGGQLFLHTSCARIDSSCRIINNTFEGIQNGEWICFTKDVEKKPYGKQGSYCSCPFFIVNNTITGKDDVVRSKVSSTYYTPLIIITSVLYCLHNNFSNFIGGTRYTKDSNDVVTANSIVVYDIYYFGSKLYYANNKIRNFAHITSRASIGAGITKAKGSYLPSGLVQHHHIPFVRYYKYNEYLNIEQDIAAIWNNRTYASDVIQEELDADDLVVLKEEIGFKFFGLSWGYGSTVGKSRIPLKEYVFSNNIINVGDGPIFSDSFGNYGISAESIEIEGNTFTSKNIVSNTYSAPNAAFTNRWLFPIFIAKYYTDTQHTSLVLKNNIFNVPNHDIHFFMAKYNSTENSTAYGTLLPPAEADINDIGNNTCPASSSILIKRYDIKGGAGSSASYKDYGSSY